MVGTPGHPVGSIAPPAIGRRDVRVRAHVANRTVLPVPLLAVTAELRLLTVHAHPDDEASKGAATVGKYVAEGVEATLVCCTGGEAGEVLNPAMDRPEVHENMAEVRTPGARARRRRPSGSPRWSMLGYRDSGMPDSPENADPALLRPGRPRTRPSERLVRIIRRIRPAGDPHLRRRADRATRTPTTCGSTTSRSSPGTPPATPTGSPTPGEPWTPSKLYYSTWARARFTAMHEAFLADGLESPFDQKWFDRPSQDHQITTRIDITGYYAVRSAALRAHATQIDPDERRSGSASRRDRRARPYPWEDFELADSRVADRRCPRTTCSPGCADRRPPA